MEESGHYYTVYITSLAVGFKKGVAYKQAVLAQMPDEVGWLDAANLHEKYCFSSKETDLNNSSRKVPNEWRYLIETVLHSLTGGSSADQRNKTGSMLNRFRADSVEFGLLLHRLGDTYAHSIMKNETELYSVKMDSVCYNPYQIGHLRHGHDADYPFLRQSLFFSYLENLFSTLNGKAESENGLCPNPQDSLVDRKANKLSLLELKNIFQYIFDHNIRACLEGGLSKEFDARMFIEDIRRAAKRHLNIEMEPYRPENEEPMSLSIFLSKHPEIAARVSNVKLQSAIDNINKGLLTN